MKMTEFCWLDYVNHTAQSFFMNDLVLKKGEGIVPHKHDYYEFYIVLQGSFEETCAGQSRIMPRKSVCLLRPQDEHCLWGAEDTANVLRNIAVQRDRFESIMNQLGNTPRKPWGKHLPDQATFQTLLQKTEQALRVSHQPSLWDFTMETILKEVLLLAVMGDAAFDRPRWLNELIRMMEQEENYIIGLPRMIELSGKSTATLCRAFKRYYNMTPTEYINMLRLARGAFLLQFSNQPIIDIIFDCGFNNVSYFNRLFKRRYHQAPLQYRKKTSFFY